MGDVEVLDYDLPDEAIAQEPAESRSAARLLVALGDKDPIHRRVADLAGLVGPGDLIVYNTSRVLPARLRLTRRSGAPAEVLLIEPTGDPGCWSALVRPGRRLPSGTVLYWLERAVVSVGEALDDGLRLVRFVDDDAVEVMALAGVLPLPPYIRRAPADPERYQTVYADRPGSVAAPTAGLHLTTEVLAGCVAAGASLAQLDLAVGLGTFRPVSSSTVEEHHMHAEAYSVPAETMQACRSARRVIAIGTTTLRALESAAASGSSAGRTSLYIYGDYPFKAVDVLLTNFHQPRSTLLLLLDAFYGPNWRELYSLALAEGYRFLSFGDAMLVDRHHRSGTDRSRL